MDRRVGAEFGPQGPGGAFRIGLLALLALALSGCATVPALNISNSEFSDLERAMTAHIDVLASDEFGGRRPGTQGERLTLAYIQNELEAAGLESGTNDPANPWLAPVELVRSQSVSDRLEFIKDGQRIALASDEAFASTNLRRSLLEYAPLVFAGKSGAAPTPDEYVGQVVILLGADGSTVREREAAFEAGAAAVMQLVDEVELLTSIREARSEERFRLAEETRDDLTVFVTKEAFGRIVGEEKLASLIEQSGARDFAAVPLDVTARIEATSQARSVTSHNLIGRLHGTQPQSGAIILMGHWDHFGTCGEDGANDRICNGAVDNASGIALMIELAQRLKARGPFERDIYFLATTAEEWGLLGAKAFIAQPPLPLDEIVMTFNFDTVAIARRGTPVAFVGQGYTPLDDRVLAAIERNGRTMGSQITASQFLKRQDSWAFLEAGVPALALTSGLGDDIQLEIYLQSRYHQSSDNPSDLELGGAIEDLLLHEDLVTELASVARYPTSAD